MRAWGMNSAHRFMRKSKLSGIERDKKLQRLWYHRARLAGSVGGSLAPGKGAGEPGGEEDQEEREPGAQDAPEHVEALLDEERYDEYIHEGYDPKKPDQAIANIVRNYGALRKNHSLLDSEINQASERLKALAEVISEERAKALGMTGKNPADYVDLAKLRQMLAEYCQVDAKLFEAKRELNDLGLDLR